MRHEHALDGQVQERPKALDDPGVVLLADPRPREPQPALAHDHEVAEDERPVLLDPEDALVPAPRTPPPRRPAGWSTVPP